MGMTVKSRAKQSNTDGKQRGGTLPWREAGFQELADNISDGVFCINPAGYFTFVNKVVTERSGMRPDKSMLLASLISFIPYTVMRPYRTFKES